MSGLQREFPALRPRFKQSCGTAALKNGVGLLPLVVT